MPKTVPIGDPRVAEAYGKMAKVLKDLGKYCETAEKISKLIILVLNSDDPRKVADVGADVLTDIIVKGVTASPILGMVVKAMVGDVLKEVLSELIYRIMVPAPTPQAVNPGKTPGVLQKDALDLKFFRPAEGLPNN